MPAGSGKTLYLGSGEFWRMRFLEGYHNRLWIKMARFAAAGATQQKKFGRFLLARSVPVGNVNIEAQVKGKDLLPLPRDVTPTVLIKKLNRKEDKVEILRTDLKPKPGDEQWQGYFQGSIQLKEPGEYEFQLPIPNTGEMLRQTLIVRKSNPELDNVRTNFGYLYQLASEAGPMLNKLPAELRKQIEPKLQVPTDVASASPEKASRRLFFTLSSADEVAKLFLQVQPKTETTKGRLRDLWDEGFTTEYFVNAYWSSLLAPLVVGVIGVLILCLMRQFVGALVFFGICVFMTGVIAVFNQIFLSVMSDNLPVHFSYLMSVLVGLLGIEWLARKLLRLA
jgi:hypothetical protein